MKITKGWIESHGACGDGAAWGIETVKDGMGLDDLLPKFKRSDWLIWTLVRSGSITHRQTVKLACVCARQSLKYVKAGELCPEKAIIAAEIWIDAPSETTRHSATNAAYAAYAAYAAGAVANSAGAAAYAASAVANSAGAAANSAYAAANAAGAANATRDKAHKHACKLILAELKKKSFKALI